MIVPIWPCDKYPECPHPYQPCSECKPIEEIEVASFEPDYPEEIMDKLEVTCSFDYLEVFTKDHPAPWTGYNQKGDVVIVEHSRDPIGEFYRVETFTSDDYVSIDVYRPDGSHVNKIQKWN